MDDHLLRRTAAPLVGWLVGVGVQLQQAALWTVVQYGAAIAAALLLWWPARRCGRWSSTACAAAAAAALAFGATGLHASLRLADALDPANEGADLVVTGIVASLPEQGDSGARFQLDVEQASSPDGTPVTVPALLALGWYRGFHDDAAAVQPGLAVTVGERWRWTLRLRRPAGTLNPNGRDHELTLFEDGVRATGVVRDRPAPVRLAATWRHPVERLRQRVRDAIVRSVPDRRAAGVLAALAVGDQSAIERDDWALFRSAGIAHVVSISGVHITMFAWLAGLLIAAVWRRSERAALICPAQTAARAGGVLAAAAYALLAGWGVPAQRTVWMLAIVAVLRLSGLHWPWPLVLLTAAAAVTAADPWALLQPGFWLSFTAVALLMASEPVTGRARDATAAYAERPLSTASSAATPISAGVGVDVQAHAQADADADTDTDTDARPEPEPEPEKTTTIPAPRPAPTSTTAPRWQPAARAMAGHVRAGWRAQAIATVGLAPLTLVFFQQLSVVGFAANLVAIPLVTLVITPLALLGAIAAPLWSAGAWGVQALCGCLGWLVAWPAAVWQVPAAPLWAQLAGLAAAAIGMLPLPWRLRLLALPLAAPLLWPPVPRPAPGHYELIAADVGQGGAVIVRTHAHVLLYDAGPAYGPQADAGERVLVPLLQSLGMAHVDRMVLSHRDLDHVGGARSVLNGVKVDDVLSSLEASHPLLAIAPHPTRCTAGQTWDWDGVHFAILQPDAGAYAGEGSGKRRSNAVSCVLRVSSGASGSALLPGDIERPQEEALVAAGPAALRCDILLVPHHGSRTSSTAAFIDAVAPHHAVVQSGYRNRFGHPAPDVVARYRARGIDLVASPDCGAWLWRDGVATCWRVAQRRYWQRLPG